MAVMSLRHTETNLRHTETNLRHTVHEPLPNRTTFLKPCFMCIIKEFKNILTQWQNSVPEVLFIECHE